jgi:D-lactate dehydrogenase (cytochrome)
MTYQNAIEKLVQTFGEKLSVSHAVRDQHATDEGGYSTGAPDAVLLAEDTDDVAEAVKICAAHHMPVIAYGAGTSLEGHITTPKGGLTIDLTAMNKVITVNQNDMDVRIEAGMTRKALNEHLRDSGLFFPIDPGADATIGGMIATRASGTNAVKYGTMREQLLSLKVVTAAGEIIETGTRSKKSAAGYDLTHLFAGSEGTLGIITEVSLKLHGIPEKIAAGVCRFAGMEDAVNTVINTIQLGLPVSRIELLDAISIKAVNAYSKTDFPEEVTLFLEFSGSENSVAEQIETFAEIAESYGGTAIEFAERQEDINRLWHARHQLYWATKALAPDKNSITTDVCVPISRLADCMLETREELEKSGFLSSLLGHVGDGNFHTIILFDGISESECQQVKTLADNMAKRAIDMGGTCTGEHGIGTGKRAYLEWERGASVDMMKQIKMALDPKDIMNPGKIFLGKS